MAHLTSRLGCLAGILVSRALCLVSLLMSKAVNKTESERAGGGSCWKTLTEGEMNKKHWPQQALVCVYVCMCTHVREKERERMGEGKKEKKGTRRSCQEHLVNRGKNWFYFCLKLLYTFSLPGKKRE